MCDVIPFKDVAGVCDKCGAPLKGRQRRWCSKRCFNWFEQNHRWTDARRAAKRRDSYRCVRCKAGREANLEVNHKEPRNGQGYGRGCWHHVTKLETVCRACHQKITNEQRKLRKIRERGESRQ